MVVLSYGLNTRTGASIPFEVDLELHNYPEGLASIVVSMSAVPVFLGGVD